MTHREELLAAVDARDRSRHYFAPLVDSLYAASVAGKTWASDATVADQIEAGRQCGYHPLFNQYLPSEQQVNPAISSEVVLLESSAEQRVYDQIIRTPRGNLVRRAIEQPRKGVTNIGDWLTSAEQFPIIHWLCEDLLAGKQDALIRQRFGQFVQATRPYGCTEVQVELPYFVFALPGYGDTPILLYLEERDAFIKLMEHVEAALLHVTDLLLEVGVDFIWIGTPGTELLSPQFMDEILVPQSIHMTRHVHAKGGRVHFHCCGQSALWIQKGYFNAIGMDILETLSEAPAGNLPSLSAARAAIDPRIVTKGNIDLDLLQRGTPEACERRAREILAATAGHPHLLGGADGILYGTPIANMQRVAAVGRGE